MRLYPKISWFTEHRGWEDYLSAAAGAVIVFSPVLAGGNADVIVMITTGFCGVLITMLALLELMSFQRWEEVLELICGAWMVASPFAFGYGGALRTWHFALGGIVVALAMLEIWQDRNRSAES